MDNRQALIISYARDYIGVNYHHQGRNRAGIDCIGLVIAVGRDMGYTIHDTWAYEQIPNPKVLYDGLDANATRVYDPAEPGDILIFRINKEPQHAAILTDDGTLVHAYERSVKVVENRYSNGWKKRLMRVYRYE